MLSEEGPFLGLVTSYVYSKRYIEKEDIPYVLGVKVWLPTAALCRGQGMGQWMHTNGSIYHTGSLAMECANMAS